MRIAPWITRRALFGAVLPGTIVSVHLSTGLAFAKTGVACVCIETAAGEIVVALDVARAPITANNFLRLVEKKVYDTNGSFYRSVAPSRDGNPVPIDVIQGGLGSISSPLPPIAHESTAVTGLHHVDGAISMARSVPGSASSEFFICIGDNPALDHGGKRVADGLGFAAFGRVISGMQTVRHIHALPLSDDGAGAAAAGQFLKVPVAFRRVRRADDS